MSHTSDGMILKQLLGEDHGVKQVWAITIRLGDGTVLQGTAEFFFEIQPAIYAILGHREGVAEIAIRPLLIGS